MSRKFMEKPKIANKHGDTSEVRDAAARRSDRKHAHRSAPAVDPLPGRQPPVSWIGGQSSPNRKVGPGSNSEST